MHISDIVCTYTYLWVLYDNYVHINILVGNIMSMYLICHKNIPTHLQVPMHIATFIIQHPQLCTCIWDQASKHIVHVGLIAKLHLVIHITMNILQCEYAINYL